VTSINAACLNFFCPIKSNRIFTIDFKCQLTAIEYEPNQVVDNNLYLAHEQFKEGYPKLARISASDFKLPKKA
jgi:hypothetical protein